MKHIPKYELAEIRSNMRSFVFVFSRGVWSLDHSDGLMENLSYRIQHDFI
jgi:hypothetical protein